MLNKIILIGRIADELSLRYTGNGNAVCNYTLAVERPYQSKEGKKDVDFIKIVTWQKLAKTCANHLGKGRLIAVEGYLQIRKSKGDDGRTFVNPEVVANNVRFLDWPDDNKKSSSSNDDTSSKENEVEEDDLEFNVPF